MSNIKSRIDKIRDYFKEMQVITTEDGIQYIYIIIGIPNGWHISDDTESKYNLTIQNTNDGIFFIAEMSDDAFERIFDSIDYNVRLNVTAEEKAKIFKQKIQELQNIFENDDIPIENLRDLTFTYKQPKIKKKIEKLEEEKEEQKDE